MLGFVGGYRRNGDQGKRGVHVEVGVGEGVVPAQGEGHVASVTRVGQICWKEEENGGMLGEG